MSRMISTVIVLLLCSMIFGCKEKTIPATTASSGSEVAISSPPPSVPDPFLPRDPLENLNASAPVPPKVAPKIEPQPVPSPSAPDLFAAVKPDEPKAVEPPPAPAPPESFAIVKSEEPKAVEPKPVPPPSAPEPFAVVKPDEPKAVELSPAPAPPEPFAVVKPEEPKAVEPKPVPPPSAPEPFAVVKPDEPKAVELSPAPAPPEPFAVVKPEEPKAAEPPPDLVLPESFATVKAEESKTVEPLPEPFAVVNQEEPKPVEEPRLVGETMPFMQSDQPAPTPVTSEPEKPEPVVAPEPTVSVTPVAQAPAVQSEKPEQVSIAAVTPKMDDPLAEFFVDWPKPKLLLLFTGFMDGYVEPCGCAGMDRMKGGLSRRHTLFKELEKKGWPVMAIDGGNLNKGFGRQEELKYNFVIDESLRLMKYGAAGIGNRELLFPTEVLILYAVDVPGNPKRYTSANVAILDFDPTCTAPFRVLEEAGMKIGVTSVLGSSLLKGINNQDIQRDDALRRLKGDLPEVEGVLPQLNEAKCDRKALIVHGTTEEINRIVKAVPFFDFVIGSDTPAEPPLEPNWIGNSMLIEVGEKGKFAVAIGLYDDPDKPLRYQRIPLDSRFQNSNEIIALMQLYQNQLQNTGLKGLGIKPIVDRRAAENGKYVGSKSCADCHEPSFSVWKKSKHAAAWHSLAVTSKPARTFDPECIACHVVGWSPAEFLPYENGFLGEKETPALLDVGCESCHGPGENHNQAEKGKDDALKTKLRQNMRLALDGNVAKKRCIECHDGDNSPNFDFETYWPKIVHEESGE